MVLTRGMKRRAEAQEVLREKSKNIPCKWFSGGQGWCLHGQECYYNHDFDETMMAQEQEACVICYESPQHYGLLEDCSHVFCLECIRKWREHNIYELEDNNTANQRRCPVCRTRSRLVLPSNYLPIDAQKTKMMNEKKKRCGEIPCKYFSNFLPSKTFVNDPLLFHCPYFNDCLYAHQYNGERFVHTPEMIFKQLDWLALQEDDLWEYQSEPDTGWDSDEEGEIVDHHYVWSSWMEEDESGDVAGSDDENPIEIDSDATECPSGP